MSNPLACWGGALVVAGLLSALPERNPFPVGNDAQLISAQDSAKANPVGAPAIGSASCCTDTSEPVASRSAAAEEPRSDTPACHEAFKVLDQQLTGFGQTSPLCLIRNSQVQEELGLSADQAKAVAEIDRANLAARREGMQRVRHAASGAARREAWQQLEDELSEQREATHRKLREVLNPDQWRRLSQLALQLRGTQALYFEDVQQAIGLSDRQRFELIQLSDKREFERNIVTNRAREGRVPKEVLKAQLAELNQRIEMQLMAVLSPQQREMFTALQGEKFKFHHLGVDENRLATHSTQATR